MKGHAILVGVNVVNPVHYQSRRKFDPALINVNDLAYTLDSFSSEGYSIGDDDKLVGESATWSNFKARLEDYKKKLSEENYLVLYFTGHAVKVNVDGREEEFYCFHDQMILALELEAELLKIEEENSGKKINVVIIADTCYGANLNPRIADVDSSEVIGLEEVVKLSEFERYVRKVNDFRTSNIITYPMNVGLFYSSGLDLKTYGGRNDRRTPYTDKFIRVLLDNRFVGNYFQFSKFIKNRYSLEGKPGFVNMGYSRTFFSQNFPIRFNNSITRVQKSNAVNITVETPVNDEELVAANINLSAEHEILESDLDDGIFYENRGELDILYQDVISYLDTNGKYVDVEAVMLVRVEKGNGSKTIRITKSSVNDQGDYIPGNSAMRYANIDEAKYKGAIVVIDSDNYVIGGEPIKGDVTNGLGGG